MMDMSFYWSHRLLHHPKLYWIHKQHHQYNITISLAATYAHPLEFIFGNVIPYSLGFLILKNFMGVHIVSILIWNFYGVLDTSEGHSGYEWDWCQLSFLPWKLKANYHDFHHTHNSGNFGSSFGLWDTLMGTNKDYWKVHGKQSWFNPQYNFIISWALHPFYQDQVKPVLWRPGEIYFLAPLHQLLHHRPRNGETFLAGIAGHIQW